MSLFSILIRVYVPVACPQLVNRNSSKSTKANGVLASFSGSNTPIGIKTGLSKVDSVTDPSLETTSTQSPPQLVDRPYGAST
jgi:hypothetical protein